MVKLFILGLLLSCFTVNGQLLRKKPIHPGVASTTTRFYNNSAGNGFWSLENIDTEGRVIERKNYRDQILMHHEKYSYNPQGDITAIFVEDDINRPLQKDTTSYSYCYAGNRIVYQKCVFPNSDSLVLGLKATNRIPC